jgi:nucleoside-diphosphate-sugar epimerase
MEEGGVSTVLVTGGSGFIGGYCVMQLLAAGHTVRATVRDLKREADVRAMLKAAGADAGDRLSFFAATLESDAGWPQAVAGCDYVLHVASPLSERMPKNEDELIVPAREGVLRVLRAARTAGVRRVVLTSSFSAVGDGAAAGKTAFDETDWTDANAPELDAYSKSKTLAERAAWDFVGKEGGLELAVVNPVLVLGPVTTADFSPSILLVQRLMDGAVPGGPKLRFGLVDVRDIADLHIRAMTHPAAKGERFIGTAGDFLWIRDIARILRERRGPAAKRVPTRQLPNWMVRLVALRDPAVRQVSSELGKTKNATSEKARRLLGWTPRPREDAIVAAAESLWRLGLLKDSPKKAA